MPYVIGQSASGSNGDGDTTHPPFTAPLLQELADLYEMVDNQVADVRDSDSPEEKVVVIEGEEKGTTNSKQCEISTEKNDEKQSGDDGNGQQIKTDAPTMVANNDEENPAAAGKGGDAIKQSAIVPFLKLLRFFIK
jgi:hypothetical protein